MKIKYSLLEKWCDCNLTGKELGILVYVARYQDNYGHAKGIYYRDVCKACHICKQTFYNSLRSLKRKGIITYSQGKHDFNITILDNDFSYPGAFNEGYINVSRNVFESKKFNNLRVGEKMLMLLLMKITYENGKSYQIGRANFYRKYMELLGITKCILRGYLHSLRSFFSVGSKDGKYYITYLKSVLNPRQQASEIDQYLGHLVRRDCRHNRIKKVDESTIKDIITLIKQYGKAAREQDQDILSVLSGCIQSSIRDKKEKSLNCKYLHLLIKDALGLGKRMATIT